MHTKALGRIALLLAVLMCLSAALCSAEEAPEYEPTFAAEPTVEPVEALRSARFRAVGDLMAHKKQLDIARLADGSYDFHPQYALVSEALANGDYTIANLETTIGQYRDMAYSGFPLFNTPEALLDAVRDAGVDFLTLANNHMLDRYFEGLLSTVEHVDAWGFDHGGANRSLEEKQTPVVVDVNGIRVGMLCYTQMTNGMEAHCNAAVKEYGVNYMRKADYAEDVRKLREAGADVVFAMPHWGEEYKRQPESNTVNQARRLIAAGVDVVLGSHPHMVQPVRFEEVQSEDGQTRRGLVAYSLGNFISNMSVQYTDSGIILDFTVQERQTGGFDIENVRVVPIYCWRRSDMIQALPSLKYLDVAPEGMAKDTYARLKASYSELRALIDADIPFIEG